MDLLLIISTVFAAVACTVFVAVYATRPWQSTPMGRSIMLKDIALALVAWIAILKRVDESVASIDLWPHLIPLVVLGWVSVGLSMAYRTFVLWRVEDDDEGEP